MGELHNSQLKRPDKIKRIMKIVFYIIGVLALGEGSGDSSSQQLEEFNRVTMNIDLTMELVGTTDKLE